MARIATVPTVDNIYGNTPGNGPSARFSGAQNMADPTRLQQQLVHDIVQYQAEQDRTDAIYAASKLQSELDRLRYDTKEGFEARSGLSAMENPDGSSVYKEYEDRVRDAANLQMDRLSPQAKQHYAQIAQDKLVSFDRSLMSHQFVQNREWMLNVNEGAISNEMRNAVLNAKSDPDIALSSIAKIDGHAYEIGKIRGWSPEYTEAMSSKMKSSAVSSIIGEMSDNGDVALAFSWFDKFSKAMEPNDIIRLRTTLDHKKAVMLGEQAADQVVGLLQPGSGSDLYRALHDTTVAVESNGKSTGADGRTLKSAQNRNGTFDHGKYQLNGTNGPKAAKLAGVAWDKERLENDSAYADVLGKAFFDEHVRTSAQTFKGDIGKMIASYNCGIGGVQKAEKQAEKWNKENPNNPKDWLAFTPEITQQRQKKAMALFGRRKTLPTALEIDKQLRKIPELAGNPTAMKAAQLRADRVLKMMKDAEQQTQSNSLTDIFATLYDNRGNLSSVSSEALRNIDPKDIPRVYEFASKMSKGVNVQTDYSAYSDLSAAAANDPDRFAATNIYAGYRDKLSDTDLKHFIDLQAKMSDPAKRSEVATTQQQLQTAHQLLGLGKKDDEKKGKFDHAARRLIADAELEKGRKLTYDERETIIKKMMLPSNVSGWFGLGSKKMYEVFGTADGDQAKPAMSGDEAEMIRQALLKQGITPTEANINQAFQRKYGVR